MGHEENSQNDIISIIVPVYNVERYVERCVSSLASQTYRNLEIILIDDGSPDNSGKICDELALRDSRIIVKHQENKGIFVDADDWVHEEYIRILYQQIVTYNAQISACGTEIRSDQGHIAYYFQDLQSIRVFHKDEAMRELLMDQMIRNVAWNKLYQKDLFDEIRFPEGRIFEDIATTYRLIDKTEIIVFTGVPLYYYYKSEESIIRSKYTKAKFDKLTAERERAEFFRNHYPSMFLTASGIYVKSTLNALVASAGIADLKNERLKVRLDLLLWLKNEKKLRLPLKDRMAIVLLKTSLSLYDATVCKVCHVIAKYQNNEQRMG